MMCNFAPSSEADVALVMIALATFIMGIIGARRALRQWEKSMQINQSKAIYAMTRGLFKDEKVCQMLYAIDHNDSSFAINTRDDEMTIDKIFVFFDHLSWMQDNKLIELDNHVLLYWKNLLVKNEKVKFYWNSQKSIFLDKMPYNNLKKFFGGEN